MLRFFLNNCSLDLGLLADCIVVISHLTQDRPLRHGELTVKDVKTTSAFNEVLVEFFTDCQGNLHEELATPPGTLLVKQFKEAARSAPFSESLLSSSFQLPAEADLAANRETKLVLDYLLSLLGHTVLAFAPFQIPRFDQALRIGNSPSSQTATGQGSSALAGAGAPGSFYFAISKKGGALGNVPVQIARMHEALLNQVSGNEAPSSQGSTSAPHHLRPENLQQGQSAFLQYQELSNSALRNMSRLLKLSLLQHPLLTCKAGEDSGAQ